MHLRAFYFVVGVLWGSRALLPDVVHNYSTQKQPASTPEIFWCADTCHSTCFQNCCKEKIKELPVEMGQKD